MLDKGQIIQIPANAKRFKSVKPEFNSLKDELLWEVNQHQYTLFDGFILDGHSGLEQFKLGQRKGIHPQGGTVEPLYVIGKDYANQRLFVGEGHDHPGLWRKVLQYPMDRVDWKINHSSYYEPFNIQGIEVTFKADYLEENIPAILLVIEDYVYIKLKEKVNVQVQEQPAKIFWKNDILLEIKEE